MRTVGEVWLPTPFRLSSGTGKPRTPGMHAASQTSELCMKKAREVWLPTRFRLSPGTGRPRTLGMHAA